jgi:hypothetical protein
VLKEENPVAEEEELPEHSWKSLKFCTSQSAVREARMLQNLVASTAVEQPGDRQA